MQSAHYDTRLVLVSLLISVLAAWVALDLSGRIHLQRTKQRRVIWLASGSLAMGVGIWSMHYVGMLAYKMPMPVLYDWPTVFLSMVAAVASSGIALSVVSRKTMSWTSTLVGSAFMGGGIAAMHYIGMSAMRMPSRLVYSWPLVLLSVAAAVVISMAGLWLTFGSKAIAHSWTRRKGASAVLMGLAIPAMHYIGMAAAHWTAGPGNYSPAQLRHAVLVSNFSTIGIVMVTVLVLVVAMVSAEVDRQVSRFESALWSSTRGNRQLDQHNKRLQAAFRAGGAGIWECNLENGLSYVDESLQALLGILRSDGPVGLTSWRSRVHPDDLGIFDAKWSASLGSGDKYENEYRIVNRAGEVRWVRSVASIVRSESGSAQRVVGMTWDVTAERAREQQTADLAKRFHMTLEAIGDAVISTDEHRRIVYVNRAASQIVGWEAEECIGRPLQEVFITRDERSGALRGDPIQRCIDGGGLLLAEDGVLISRTGTRHNIRKHIALMDEGNAAVLTFQDITDARRMALELTHAATHDALTGLANRAAFEKGLRRLWEDSHDSSRTHCVCLLDLDRFKIINDTSGHLAGDALLREIAGVLKTSLRATDLAARMGGDEFLLLLADTSTEAAKACMSRVLESVSALRFPWHGRVYEVTASIGLATFDCSSPEPEVLVSQADVALFTAKRQGRNQIAVYSRDSGVALSDHLEMQVAADLKNGIDEGRFELHAQAIVSPCAVHDARYFELLLRMRDKSGKLIPPCDFIPAAERYGLMATIDRWVIRTALDAIRNHHAEELGFRFAINLSAASLSDPTLWDFVSEQFLRTGVQPSSITFEVTETGVIQHFEHAKEFMFKARMAGCPIALDDFGTGLSSLSYLKEFSVDTIKIDGSFIRNMADSVLDQAIVRSVAEVARSMKATTVAECVEDLATLNALKLLEVDLVQGWAIGKPVPLGDVLASPGEDRGADSTAGGLFLVERGAA